MMKINFVIIFFLFLIVIIDGVDEDFFDDLWKNLKPSTSKNFKKQKFGENYAIKEEIVDIDNYEIHEQQNANKIIIKHENCNEKEMEDTKPKILQKMKKEKTLEENNNLKTKIKMPKIEMDQLSKESLENEFDEQADQNVCSADQSNSSEDEDYNKIKSEKRNEMEILNKFNLLKKELRKVNIYKTLTNTQFEREIAKKLGTNRNKIYKLKKKLGQKREKRTEESEETKKELIRKFDELRKEKIYGFKYDEKKRKKIESEIANELGINRKKIYQWKRELNKEFEIKKKFSTHEKIEKIKQFEKIIKEFSKKFNLKTTWKIKEKIAEKIGVRLKTICDWKRKLNLITRKNKICTDAEKLEYVKRSEEMAERNPMMSKKKIAVTLGIPCTNLRRWTKKFGTKLIR